MNQLLVTLLISCTCEPWSLGAAIQHEGGTSRRLLDDVLTQPREHDWYTYRIWHLHANRFHRIASFHLYLSECTFKLDPSRRILLPSRMLWPWGCQLRVPDSTSLSAACFFRCAARQACSTGSDARHNIDR